MKVENHPLAPDEIKTLRLNKQERDVLRKAAGILARARRFSVDDDNDYVTDIALASYVCEELSNSGELDVSP